MSQQPDSPAVQQTDRSTVRLVPVATYEALVGALKTVSAGLKCGHITSKPIMRDDPEAEVLAMVSLESVVDEALGMLDVEAVRPEAAS